jgi:hypothetical protein
MKHPALARLALFALPALLAVSARAQSVTLDFSSLGTALVSFNSSSELTFSPDATTGQDFQIGASSIAGLVGYTGTIEGTFTIGQVSSFGMGMFQGEDAEVSGSGTLTISDGTSSTFTAKLSWDTIATLGTSGALNSIGEENLSDFTYTGTNPVLKALAADTSGTAVASFQFAPGESLTALSSGTNSTSYSGSLQAIPEPETYAAAFGLLALFGTLALRRLQPVTVTAD